MPEQKPTENEVPQDLVPAEGGSSLLAKIKVAAFVLLVIGGECVLAFFCFPSRADLIRALPADGAADEDSIGDAMETPIDVPADVLEPDLGDFSVTSYIHLTNTHLRIDFKLVGIVKTEEEAEFLTRMEANRHRIREKVIITVRSMSMADLLEDPALGLLKRKIMVNLNRILGKELLRDVIFSDYSIIEQS